MRHLFISIYLLLMGPLAQGSAELPCGDASLAQQDLYQAVRRGDAATVASLLSNGTDPDFSCSDRLDCPGAGQLSVSLSPIALAALLDDNAENLQCLDALIKAGADPDFQDEANPTAPTALMWAVYHSVPIVDRLLLAGADINLAAVTPDQMPAETNERSLSPARFDLPALNNPKLWAFCPEPPFEWGMSPLMLAATCAPLSISQELLHYGADLNAISTTRGNVLGFAVAPQGTNVGPSRLDSVAFFIRNGANLEVADSDGNTPLLRDLDYSFNYDPKLFSLLLQAGANPYHQVRGFNALGLAVLHGDCDAVQALIKKNVDISDGGHSGWLGDVKRPLQLASGILPPDLCFQALLDAGADPNLPSIDAQGRSVTPMQSAAHAQTEAKVQKLIDTGAKVEELPNDERSPSPLALAVGMYSWTVKDGRLRVIKKLIAAGAAVDVRFIPVENDLTPYTGSYAYGTPLISAVLQGDTELMAVLLGVGAQANFSNRWNQTPLELAARVDELPALKLLLSKGANSCLVDRFGKNTLDEATGTCRTYLSHIRCAP